MDNLDRILHWITLGVFIIAIAIFLTTPVTALAWVGPFPGFVVENTLVVADVHGIGWPGYDLGIRYPQRITRIDDYAVYSVAEYEGARAMFRTGDTATIVTRLPDGTTQTYENVQFIGFPPQDLLRLFWLPYFIGFAFLMIGVWVYLKRGTQWSGRAFAYFCGCTSITIGLAFDLITAHSADGIWTAAIAQEGGAMFSMAMLFPTTWESLRQKSWLRLLPYAVSISIALYGLSVLYSESAPWAYISAWRISYLYAGLGVIAFLGSLVYRMRQPLSSAARQQSRMILFGSFFAFAPAIIWLIGPFLGLELPWDYIIMMPFLLVFPLTTGFAILRYRLWDFDFFINRTLIYGMLTGLVLLIYFTGIVFLERIFHVFMGETSQITATLVTLAIAILFNPLRKRVQTFVDTRFYRQKYNTPLILSSLAKSLHEQVELSEITERMETIIYETLHPLHVFTWLKTPAGYRVYIDDDRDLRTDRNNATIQAGDPIVSLILQVPGVLPIDHAFTGSPGERLLKDHRVRLILPLVYQKELIGWISLGPRLDEELREDTYAMDDQNLLTNIALQAAPALRVAQLLNEQKLEALENERIQQEMQVARLIQQTLLPRDIPVIPGWEADVFYRPSRAVGGDFYDFLLLEDGLFGILVGDVSDKGVPAALVMATTRTILRDIARRYISPAQVLLQANEILCNEFPPSIFVTCFFALINADTGVMCYANAGHNLPYLRDGDEVSELHATGMPLGMMPGMCYEEYEKTIPLGSMVLFHSDGLIEAHNPEREMFGSERLREWIRNTSTHIAEFLPCLVEDLEDFTGPGQDQEDDITLFILKRSDSEAQPGEPEQ
jgi:serine phosphatase RsbU (regulator of sigma subunit)